MNNRAKLRKEACREQQLPRERVDGGGLADFFAKVAALYPSRTQLIFVCIGTDRSTGDSFGPWVGTMLREQGWTHIIGTLDTPCDADLYESVVSGIPESQIVIAIDACLGRTDTSCRYLIADGPLFPGRATGRNLSPVGHYSVAGIVGPLSVKPYWSLQRASLYEVMGMARTVAGAINAAWPAIQ
ncbi:spore protease YyaC [Paenibacillus sp. sptzw28]|uniref:spore protease YyaC n=1 Tax=Paenibacillus sp. sptzw28 TaxID=715179 RepID=UPI001C6EEB31|nr:spore protease YyaC [Paenibacillus sp. sptzw28]QYR20573.1 spore protease YyaC [Paenibacillus sp. sptzw28]